MCNSVQVEAQAANKNIGACHCNMCRKWSSGSPYLAIDCTNVAFDGEQHITTYDSSEWAERGFCSKCGTNLFYKLKQTGQMIMSVGLFDKDDFNFDHQIFIEEKPSYYSFSNDTKNMTGEEVFAQFSGDS